MWRLRDVIGMVNETSCVLLHNLTNLMMYFFLSLWFYNCTLYVLVFFFSCFLLLFLFPSLSCFHALLTYCMFFLLNVEKRAERDNTTLCFVTQPSNSWTAAHTKGANFVHFSFFFSIGPFRKPPFEVSRMRNGMELRAECSGWGALWANAIHVCD